ncbi:MAG: hypothetical protein ACI9TA_001822 [Reinekea sp.]|jgi:hypothetical protein
MSDSNLVRIAISFRQSCASPMDSGKAALRDEFRGWRKTSIFLFFLKKSALEQRGFMTKANAPLTNH